MDNIHDSSLAGRMVSKTRFDVMIDLLGNVTLEVFFHELALSSIAVTPEARDSLLHARNSGLLHAPAKGEVRLAVGEMSRAGIVWESLGAIAIEHGELATHLTEAEIIDVCVKSVRNNNLQAMQGTFIFLSRRALGRGGFDSMYGFGATELGVTFSLYPRDKKLGTPLHVAFTMPPNVVKFRPRKTTIGGSGN